MKDKRKPETIIAELRRRLRRSDEERYRQEQLARDWKEQHRHACYSETQLRAEVAEWKRRFDALLAAIPELSNVPERAAQNEGE